MPFEEIDTDESRVRNMLKSQISIGTGGRISIANDLGKYFPSGKVTLFIDKENKLLGIKDGGKINFKESFTKDKVYHIYFLRLLSEHRVKFGRYSAEWSEKHKMVIAKIEFEEK